MSFWVYPYLPNMTTSLYSFHWLYLMCSLVCQHSKTQYNIHISDSLTHIGRIWYRKTGPSLLWWPNCLATKARYVSDIFDINDTYRTTYHRVANSRLGFYCKSQNINFPSIHSMKNLGGATKQDLGGFHPQLLVFPFVYPFNSRTGVLVHSSLANN